MTATSARGAKKNVDRAYHFRGSALSTSLSLAFRLFLVLEAVPHADHCRNPRPTGAYGISRHSSPQCARMHEYPKAVVHAYDLLA
jgi:sulfur relay (sulfurtransferase) complex TusBCD TusD component (DsrE family)